MKLKKMRQKINSRLKGATFERKIAMKMNDFFNTYALPYLVKRNLEQYREKDQGDLIGVPGFCFELKNYAQGCRPKKSWWEQVCRAAGDDDFPILIYKFSRKPVEVQMPVALFFAFQVKDYPKSFSEHFVIMEFAEFMYFLCCFLKVQDE